MTPLHHMIAKLEDAVRNHAVEPELSRMTESELRTLIYQIIQRPEHLIQSLVNAANDTSVKFRDGRERNTELRATVFDRLLELVAQAVPALNEPLRTRIRRDRGQQEITDHPLLRGLEMKAGRKVMRSDSGNRTISGQSIWVVTLMGQCSSPEIDARWAVVRHSGSIDPSEVGDEVFETEIVDSYQIADEVNDQILARMISSFASRLHEAATQNPAEHGKRDDDARSKLELALSALGGER